MASISINLSDEELSLAESRAKEEGFVRIEDYIQEALSRRLHDESDDDDEDFGAPDELSMTSIEQLKQAVRAGLNNPGRKFDKADFAEMGRELREKGRISKVADAAVPT
jgi:hypothetical protein